MLDENLPVFLLKSSSEKPKVNSTFYFSHHGSDFEPSYSVRHLDPDQHGSRNRYAAGLYDAYNPDVLYGEVLLVPQWTQPTLSADQIRANGGVPPPPEPILPEDFAIQLYNPDQQIRVQHKSASLTKAESWTFEMPLQSFRMPSISTLDRSQHDPTASEYTPKLALKWKKDGRLSKDLACYISGKALNPDGTSKKHKEPDITVAILKNLKEVTLYEPNLVRMELEDVKGFEVALLLSVVVIRDVYFSNMKQTFNITNRKGSTTSPTTSPINTIAGPALPSQQILPVRPAQGTGRDPRVPPTDALSQWEIDAETERLRKQAAAEEKAQKRHDEEEQRQIKKMLEAEERENQRQQAQQQAEIDRETERLRKMFGREDSSARPSLPPRPMQHRHSQSAIPEDGMSSSQSTPYGGGASSSSGLGPYALGAASQSSFLHPDNQRLKQKSSIFSFRRHSDNNEDGGRLTKKRSAIW